MLGGFFGCECRMHDGLACCECRKHGGLRRSLRRSAGRNVDHVDRLERRQRTAIEHSGEGGAAGVGDLGEAEVELPELRQPSCRRRRRTCRRRWCNEGGEALVAEWVAREREYQERGHPPQGRREANQSRVSDGGVAQFQEFDPRQGASVQGGGERQRACVAHMHPKT